jgi:molybdopterin molybdotransferase
VKFPSGFDRNKPGKRRDYLRVRVRPDGTGGFELQPFPHQGSGVMTSICWADGLAVVPDGVTVRKGDPLDFLSFDELLR